MILKSLESLFSYDDYRAYLSEKIASAPREGYGLSGQLARAIGVHASLVSQILSGKKQLSADQALAAAEFFALSELETDYFLLLVQLDRAGTPALRTRLRGQLDRLKEQSKRLVNRIEAKTVLTEEARGIFYSQWVYSAVRQLTSVDWGSRARGVSPLDAIAATLELPPRDVRGALDFLVQYGLCIEKNGSYAVGPQSTHLAESSPWVRMHHRNWRELAARKMERMHEADLFFTCPLTMAAEDSARVRELIIQFIEQVYKVVDPSPSEELSCLNIDWFGVGKRK